MRKAFLLGLLFLLGPAGCYHYVPVTGGYDQIKQGQVVRAGLVEEESFTLSDLTVHNITGIDGEFVRADPSDLILSALWLDSSLRDVGFPGDGWSVRIPISNVARFEIKRLDRWRTAGLVAAILLGTHFGWQATMGGPGDDTGGGGSGGTVR